jgi:Pyridoxamine 5'-phosphate oxidase
MGVCRLRKGRQYWIATTRPDGAPHLMVVWGVWLQESFWFSTGASSRKARNLAVNPRCSIGTDNAAEAVIVEGTVESIDARHSEFEEFANAYQKKYAWDVREMAQPVYRFQPSVGFGFFEKKVRPDGDAMGLSVDLKTAGCHSAATIHRSPLARAIATCARHS